MLKVFGIAAGFWVLAVAMLLLVAVHHVLAHWFTFLWLTIVVVSAPFLWHWLEQYKLTAGITAKLDAVEGSLWAKLKLHFSGTGNAILLAMTSAWATAGDWISTTFHTLTGLQPGDLDPFKDVTLLHTVFSMDVVPKIVAVLTWIGVILHIKSTLAAAKIVPAPGTAAPATPTA